MFLLVGLRGFLHSILVEIYLHSRRWCPWFWETWRCHPCRFLKSSYPLKISINLRISKLFSLSNICAWLTNIFHPWLSMLQPFRYKHSNSVQSYLTNSYIFTAMSEWSKYRDKYIDWNNQDSKWNDNVFCKSRPWRSGSVCNTFLQEGCYQKFLIGTFWRGEVFSGAEFCWLALTKAPKWIKSYLQLGLFLGVWYWRNPIIKYLFLIWIIIRHLAFSLF